MFLTKSHKNFISVILCALLMFGIFFIQLNIVAMAESDTSSLQKQYDSYAKQSEQIRKQLENTKKDIKSLEERNKILGQQSQVLQNQISTLQKQLNSIANQITELNKQIEVKTQEITKKEESIAKNTELFKQRLRAMYMNGNVSYLEVLLDSDDLKSFMNRVEVLRRISKHDVELVEALKKEKKELDEIKTDLENAKAKEEKNKIEQEEKKKDLEAKRKENEAAVAEIDKNLRTLFAQENAQKDIQNKINAAMEETNRKIQEAINKNGGNGVKTDGTFTWPVPNYKTITAYFGSTDFHAHSKGHSGIDIAGTHAITGARIHGQPFVAAADGTVLIAAHQNTGNGYGKYIFIEHIMPNGTKLYTLYGHANSLAVNAGQRVTKGQVIGYVGNTGNSYGSHLHFEMRKGDGSTSNRINPLNYVSR